MQELDLLNLEVINVVEGEHKIEIEAKRPNGRKSCGNCFSFKIIKHGTRKKRFVDNPMNSKPVVLVLTQQRYRCKVCGLITQEEFDDIMDQNHQMTKRLVSFIVSRSMSEPFVSVSEQVGVDERTIRTVFLGTVDQKIRDQNKKMMRKSPQWLAIEEVEITGEMCFVLVNRETGYVFDVSTRKNLFLSIFDLRQSGFPFVTCNFNAEAVARVKKYMSPKTIVMIPHIYIQQRVHDCLMDVFTRTRADWTHREVRKYTKVKRLLEKNEENLSEEERTLLESWKSLVPANRKAFELKESVFEILNSDSREEAHVRIEEWIKDVTEDVRTEFQPMFKAFTSWVEEILVTFDYDIPNEDGTHLDDMNQHWPLLKMQNVTSFAAIRGRLVLSQKF